MTPGGNRERAMKSGVSRENREGWQVCSDVLYRGHPGLSSDMSLVTIACWEVPLSFHPKWLTYQKQNGIEASGEVKYC